MSRPDAAALDPERYRPDFPILGRTIRGGVPLVYLDNAATTQRPRQVIQAIVDTYERHYANVHRAVYELAEEATEQFEAARDKLRRFLNARSREEVIFTSGATMAINLVARSWGDSRVKAGDEILLTEMEHHANLVPWYQLAERTGAVVRHIRLTDDGRLDLSGLDRLLGPRTRLVAVTAVSNVLGTVNPVEEIAARAHAAGAVVLVDGAQSVPHQKTDVQLLDADFLVLAGHKMLGPSGVGVLYGRRELLEAMPPFLGGGSMIREVRLDGFDPAGFDDYPPYQRAARFEAGTPPIADVIGLGAAVDYLDAIGLNAIHGHEQRLVEHVCEALKAMPDLRLLGPSPEFRAGIVSFDIKGVHAHDVAHRLNKMGIAVRPGHHCAMPLHQRFGLAASTRASFYLYNTLAEADRLIEAVDLARAPLRRRK